MLGGYYGGQIYPAGSGGSFTEYFIEYILNDPAKGKIDVESPRMAQNRNRNPALSHLSDKPRMHFQLGSVAVSHERDIPSLAIPNRKSGDIIIDDTLVDDPVALVDDTEALAGEIFRSIEGPNMAPPPVKPRMATVGGAPRVGQKMYDKPMGGIVKGR